jgi:hypothetical protein
LLLLVPDESSQYEKEVNLFAAEFMLEDEAVLDTLNADNTQLNVPMELLDFKFRVTKWKGFKLVEPPIQTPSNFLHDIEMLDCEPCFC